MEQKPYIRTVQYYETDKMGIVHHSNYIRWFEESRIDLMDQMEAGYKALEDSGILIPVLSVSCTMALYVQETDRTGMRIPLSSSRFCRSPAHTRPWCILESV